MPPAASSPSSPTSSSSSTAASTGFDGAPIHDAVAVAQVIDPTLVETLRCNVAIETQSQHCDGRTVVDRWLVLDAPRNADVGIGIESERFLELLVERIATLP